MARLALLCVALLAAACGKQIGDACSTNVDCSISGDRFCDTAPPGGYCTVEGCDVDSCPGDSVCIRFYSAVQTRPCHYSSTSTRGQCGAPGDPPCCNPDERCICDDAAQCDTMAHCAPENSERRWCMRRCGKDGDCRDGYECRSTGTLGAEPVPALDRPDGEGAKFCVSRGVTQSS